MGENFNMVNSLENIDKSKVSADRIEGLDAKIQEELSTAVTGAASTIVTTDLTANRAVISNGNGKVAVSSTTSTELGYVHGVTSAIQTQLGNKQDTLVSGTNIKTINGNSVLGSGDLTVDGGSSRNIGEIVASTIPLSDAGLHLLDGGVIQGGGAYNDFVTYIAGLVSSYPDLFCSEADWQTAITNYGVCGKFVYTSGSPATVRLPKITGFVEGTTDITALGDLIEAGLPNITGDAGANDNSGYGTGAFYKNSVGNTYTWSSSGSYNKLSFDASRSSSIYGNSTTVQPQSIKVLYYIVIATSAKTQIEVDIDEVMTDLNGKVDKADLSQVHVVVETYQNGADWYRIYDDGWVEQGGYVAYPSDAAQTINLLKPYAITDYIILTGLVYNTNTYCYSPVINSKTTSSFSLYIPYANNGAYWYVCGTGA